MSEEIFGNWRRGIAHSIHTIASDYLGDDEYGNPRFDNQRSEMGELVYQLKYNQDASVLPKLIKLLDRIGNIERFDFLVPIPPTKKNRKHQPVEMITAALGVRRGVAVLGDLLENSGQSELKSISDPLVREEVLREALKLHHGERVRGKKVLLVDDLFRSGSTLNVATDILLTQGGAERVCVLAMTKTRTNR